MTKQALYGTLITNLLICSTLAVHSPHMTSALAATPMSLLTPTPEDPYNGGRPLKDDRPSMEVGLTSGTSVLARDASSEAMPGCANSRVYSRGCARFGVWGFDPKWQNKAVHPADNFYEYAVGSLVSSMEIPSDKVSWGQFEMLSKQAEKNVQQILKAEMQAGTKIGKFYASYMNTALIEKYDMDPLNTTLDIIQNLKNDFDFAKMAGAAQISFLPSPIAFGISPDDRNPTEYCVTINQGGIVLPQEYYYNPSHKKKLSAYQKHIANMLQLIGWPNASETSSDIVALESRIANVSMTPSQMRDAIARYNVMTMADLEAEAPGFRWGNFFKSAALEDAVLKKGVKIVVGSKPGVIAIAKILGNTDLNLLKSWATWQTLHSASGSLSSRFENETFAFFGKVLSGQRAQRSREDKAVAKLNSFMGEAVGKSYVERFFPEEKKLAIKQLTSDLKDAFRQRLENNKWMTKQTQRRALEKLQAYDIQVGYPNKWRNYTSVSVHRDDYFSNVQHILGFDWNYSVSRLGKPVDRDEWAMTPQTVNAYNQPNFNQVVFPAAILQPPFFDTFADMAVNYGGIGVVIGHEMTHGFDDQGRLYDQHGTLRDWWTKEDDQMFTRLSHDYGVQFTKFHQGLPENVTINAALDMGEAIADLGGLNIALQAYHNAVQKCISKSKANADPPKTCRGYTGADAQARDDRFYLGFAALWAGKMRDEALAQSVLVDPHPPNIARVNVPTRNMAEWYTAFNLSMGESFAAQNLTNVLQESERVLIW